MNAVNPLVTVITCFYNEERFLEEAIRSVLGQQYESWELILVDDGSTDRSTALAKRYAALYPGRIQYRHHPGHCNEGLSASRNLGISVAQGEYIAFLDADDVWLPGKLSYQVGIFTGNPLVTVQVQASTYWNSWSKERGRDTLVRVGVPEGLYSPPALLEVLYPLGEGAAPCPSSIIVRRDVFERCGFEDSFRGIFQLYEDQAFLAQVYLNEKVFVSDSCHNLYRRRPGSIVATVVNGGGYDMVRRYYLRWFDQHMRYHNISCRRAKVALRKAAFVYDEPLKYRLIVLLPKRLKAWTRDILAAIGMLTYSKS